MAEVVNDALKSFAETTVVPLRSTVDAQLALLEVEILNAVEEYEGGLLSSVDNQNDDDFINVTYPDQSVRQVSMRRIRDIYNQYFDILFMIRRARSD